MGGCAIVENWREADGSGQGKGLFYYQQAKKQWKQVWVTDAGLIKEKHLITTLTPLPGGRVHQVIENSRDAGKTWETVFDAEYRRSQLH